MKKILVCDSPNSKNIVQALRNSGFKEDDIMHSEKNILVMGKGRTTITTCFTKMLKEMSPKYLEKTNFLYIENIQQKLNKSQKFKINSRDKRQLNRL